MLFLCDVARTALPRSQYLVQNSCEVPPLTNIFRAALPFCLVTATRCREHLGDHEMIGFRATGILSLGLQRDCHGADAVRLRDY